MTKKGIKKADMILLFLLVLPTVGVFYALLERKFFIELLNSHYMGLFN